MIDGQKMNRKLQTATRFAVVPLLLLYCCQELIAQELSPKQSLGPGDHARSLMIGKQKRTYLLHIPKKFNRETPASVVLALHGAMMDGSMMVLFSGLDATSEAKGFLIVYPDGSGVGPFRTWNAGGVSGDMTARLADDVTFVSRLLDDLRHVVKVDEKRVYACGISNGAMMCYRLAAELSDRIAAIAPVAGTMAIDAAMPTRPVSVIHFHGTADTIVPFGGPSSSTPKFLTFKSVDETIRIWGKIDRCPETPTAADLPNIVDDGTTVRKEVYGPGQDGAEVVLISIKGGGHTWPGRKPPVSFIGKSTLDISANDLIWDFFGKHPMK